jgi:TolB-like protein/tetratricopeptide (TPR) repeat protein
LGATWIFVDRARDESRRDEITSVAVLPFRAIVREQGDPALQLGMADALIGQVSTLPGLTVRPLSSVSRHMQPDEDPMEIGRALGVSAVLEGTLQKEGDRLRVTARLLRVRDGRSLWSGRFDEKMSGIFQVQDSIASLVMLTLAEQFGTQPPHHQPRRSTLNPEAYQLYVGGVYNWQRRDIDASDAAVEQFKAAIREDPNYATAWSALASVLSYQSAFGIKPATTVFPDAKLAAQHAIGLDSEVAEAQAAMGQVLVQYEHRFAEGEKYYRHALELNPNLGIARLWSSINYLFLGRPEEALAQARRAQELEPSNLAFSANVARALYYSRQYAQAIAHLSRLLAMVPTFDDAHSLSGRALLHLGKFEEAAAHFAARNRTSPGSFGDLGRAYAMAGKVAEAHAEIDRLRARSLTGFGVHYDIAGIHALLGEFAPACDALDRALLDHSQLIGSLRLDPDFDGMRAERCVADVLRALDPS